MNRAMITRLTVLSTLLMGSLFLALGCTDTLISQEEEPVLARQETASKFRHAHLMDRALRRSDASKDGNNGRRLGLIMGVGKGLDKHRVLERYRLLERFKVLERFEYDHVFNGFAIDVEDTLGLGDFQAFLDLLDSDPDVEWFEPDIEVEPETPDNPGSGGDTPWGLVSMGADEVNRREARDVQIFIIDSGASNGNVEVDDRYDFTTNTPNAGDDNDGHGTHIAGIIAAKRDNNCDAEGVVSRRGAVNSLKVVRDDGTTELSAAVAAVEYIIGKKLAQPSTPMVVNVSLGANVDTDENASLDDAIEAAINVGVVFVISAGNEGIDAATVSPAHVEDAITVGAYGPDDDFAWFSNYGPLLDILAPGVDILSLGSDDAPDPSQTALMSGTSMAAAYVTGAVAMFLQENPQASPQQVRDALAASGRDLITGAPAGTVAKAAYVGPGGLLDIQLPPFFQYAVTSGGDIELDQEVLIAHHGGEATNINASVFANNHLDLKRDNSEIYGFGYAGGDVKPENRAAVAFVPAFNPTGLPGYRADVMEIDLPDFKAEDYQHLATRHTDGELRLAGHYDLGTYEQPLVWYVRGKLKTDGPTTISGYGVFLVKDDVEIKHDLETLGNADDTRLAIYASGNLKIKRETVLTMSGELYANEDVTLEGGFTLTGSITARKKVEFKNNDTGRSTIYYRMPSSVLTDLIWPMQ